MLTKEDIINKLKSLKVGPGLELPFRMFLMIGNDYSIDENEVNILYKFKYKLYNMCASATIHEDGIRDYYSEELVKRFEDFSKQHNGLIDLF